MYTYFTIAKINVLLMLIFNLCFRC